MTEVDAAGEELEFGARRHLPAWMGRGAVAVAAAVALVAAAAVAAEPRIETGHGVIAAPVVGPSGQSSSVAVGSTVRGYYLN